MVDIPYRIKWSLGSSVWWDIQPYHFLPNSTESFISKILLNFVYNRDSLGTPKGSIRIISLPGLCSYFLGLCSSFLPSGCWLKYWKVHARIISGRKLFCKIAYKHHLSNSPNPIKWYRNKKVSKKLKVARNSYHTIIPCKIVLPSYHVTIVSCNHCMSKRFAKFCC